MANFEHILLRTGLPAADVAKRLAGLPGMALASNQRGDLFVGRDSGDTFRIGGQVRENGFGDPEDDTVLNAYDTVWSVWSTSRNDTIQRAEADRLFQDVTRELPWPGALVYGEDWLIAVWSAEHGLRRFPPRTTPDEPHRRLWQDYAVS
jgi:hypothetical protein